MSGPIISGYEDFTDLLIDKNGETSIAKLFRWLMAIEDRTSMSLPAYLKRAVIESKVFLTKEAAVEEVTNDVLFAVNTMYAGWVITALSINQFVNGSKIRDILSTVATETFAGKTVYRHPDDILAGLSSYQSVKAPNIYSGSTPTLTTPSGVGIKDPTENFGEDDPSGRIHGTAGTKIVELPKDFRLTSGIMVDVSFAIGNTRSGVTVPLAVRLMPTIVNHEAAKQFFAMNFKLDSWMRWFKVTTGEIRFTKDFLFELDLLNERTKTLKTDKSGILEEMIDRQQNALTSYVLKILGWRADRQNIASTVHVFTKYQFDQFCRDTHCNFNNTADRLKYFRKTLSMLVAVIDNEYQYVDMYIAGIGNKGRYQFSQLQNFTKPNQYDLTSVIRSFSQTNAPRF